MHGSVGRIGPRAIAVLGDSLDIKGIGASRIGKSKFTSPLYVRYQLKHLIIFFDVPHSRFLSLHEEIKHPLC
jgi:hypothetical protein